MQRTVQANILPRKKHSMTCNENGASERQPRVSKVKTMASFPKVTECPHGAEQKREEVKRKQSFVRGNDWRMKKGRHEAELTAVERLAHSQTIRGCSPTC